jgi:hypothetical protein
MPDVASGGIGVEVGLNHRSTPRIAWGVRGQYQELGSARGTGTRGATADLNVTYHGQPMERLDPWLQIGPGYRLLWETNASTPTVLTHGFQLVRALVGVDLRAGEDIALAPVVGGDLDVFLWQKPSDGGTFALANPRLSTFVYVGVQGRFELGGERWVGRSEPLLVGGR